MTQKSELEDLKLTFRKIDSDNNGRLNSQELYERLWGEEDMTR